MNKRLAMSFMAFLVLAITTSGFATPLTPGTTLFNSDAGGGLSAPYYTSGGVPLGNALFDSMTSSFGGAFIGSVESNVYKRAGGFLTFEYIFTNNTDALSLVRATIGDASNPWLGAYISDAGADGRGSSTSLASPFWTDGDPNFLLRDPTFSGEGLTIQWRASSIGTTLLDQDGSGTGLSSRIWFETDALAYGKTGVGLIDSGSVGTSLAFAPSTIPEPATLLLLGTGLLFAAGIGRKKS